MTPESAIADLPSLFGAAEKAAKTFGPAVWWRGQSRNVACWRLVPGIFRKPRSRAEQEQLMLEFKRRAQTRYPKCPPFNDNAAWVFLMQHYRMVTRLLDWTESPLVALYFAVNAHSRDDGRLWAFSPFGHNRAETGKNVIFTGESPDFLSVILPAFNAKAPETDRILAVIGRETDIRMTVQLSVFTAHGTSQPLDERPHAGRCAMKFSIPGCAKTQLMGQLWNVGIRESTLFPDLEHLGSELGRVPFVPADGPSTSVAARDPEQTPRA
jgi:hypothetical protein